MKRLILFVILFLAIGGGFFSSCCKSPPKVVFYYRDGSVIKDTAQLFFVKRQLPAWLNTSEQQTDLHVYTYLTPIPEIIVPECARMETDHRTNLEWLYDDLEQPDIDSMIKIHRLFTMGIVAIENKTGQIVLFETNQSSPKNDCLSSDNTYTNLGSIFSFAHAMKTHHPYDRFPTSNDYSFSYYNAYGNHRLAYSMLINNRMSVTDDRTIYRELLPDKQVSEEEIGTRYHAANAAYSVVDLAQIWSLLLNEGIFRQPSVIKEVKNGEGKQLYAHKDRVKRTLDRTTALRMMQLADFSRKTISGRFRPDSVPPFLHSAYGTGSISYGGTHVYCTPDYTIAILCRIPGFRMKSLPLKSRTTVLIWEKTIHYLRKGKAGPTMPDYVKLVFPPKEEDIYLNF